jgi:hypothetical protein
VIQLRSRPAAEPGHGDVVETARRGVSDPQRYDGIPDELAFNVFRGMIVRAGETTLDELDV